MASKSFQLIQAHKADNQTALTIPFLIGGSRGPQDTNPMTSQSARGAIEELLTSFLEETPKDYVVRIYRCETPRGIGYTVAEYLHHYGPPLDHSFLEPNSEGRRTVAVSPEFAAGGSVSLPSLTDQIYQEVGSDIRLANFSFDVNEGKFRRFSDDERSFIELVLAQ
jgi:hypothetical protein